MVPNEARCNLHLEVVAELPKFLRRTGVLEENSIDFECIEFASPVAIDGVADMVNEYAQLRIVVIRNY